MLKVGDKIVILLILFSAIGIYAYFTFQSVNDYMGTKIVIIEVDGKIVYRQRLPVAETKQVKIYASNGQDWDLIEFNADRVRVIESTCPKKIVRQMGWIVRPGQQLICVPNRMLIYFQGEADNDLIDVRVF